MLKWILTPVLMFLAIVVGLSFYLSPDDLRGCEKPGVGKCQKADKIVAISGGNTNARVDEAVKLYKSGWARTVIFSGAAADKSGPSNAAAMKSRAVANGVPEHAIYIEENSETTLENAEKTAPLFSPNDRVILVTSPYHQRRAGLEFAKEAPDSVNIINHPAIDYNWSKRVWYLSPVGWWLTISETTKIIAFYVGGLF